MRRKFGSFVDVKVEAYVRSGAEVQVGGLLQRNTACEEEEESTTGEALPAVGNERTIWTKHRA